MKTRSKEPKNTNKKSKRSGYKYPALEPSVNPKSRREHVDFDYVDKLNDEEKAFLNKFTSEYYGASLAKQDAPETWKNDLHSTPELRKECRDRNNHQNTDTYNYIYNRKDGLQDVKEIIEAAQGTRNLEEEAIVIAIDTPKASNDEGN